MQAEVEPWAVSLERDPAGAICPRPIWPRLVVVAWAIVALTAAAGSSLAGDSVVLAWKTQPDSVTLVQGEHVVWQFHFGTNETKPCFYPVALPEGPDLVWHRPPEHPWHLGLWFSWKFINGVNYWEEDPKTGLLAGRTE
jgi:hypothetical protein